MGGRIRALILVVSLLGLGVLAASMLAPRWGSPPAAPVVDVAAPVLAPRTRVRVEILNAGGIPNVARSATDLLRDMGFDVVYFGNADRFDRDSSVVLDRVGSIEQARAVARATGIRAVRSEPDSSRFVDVSVLIGESWKRPSRPDAPVREAAETDSGAAWWDLRRFLPERGPPSSESGPGGSLANPEQSGER